MADYMGVEALCRWLVLQDGQVLTNPWAKARSGRVSLPQPEDIVRDCPRLAET